MKTHILAAAGAVALFALSPMAGAHEFTQGGITVDHPMAFETAPSARAGGGFMTIANDGDEDDRLIAVRAEFPKVEIHTTLEENGVSKMVHVAAIDLPAGETVALEPGGYHVMFMGLDGDPFEVGEEIEATLVFEKAGELDITFNVEARGAVGHSDHDHDHDHGHDGHEMNH
ncbi:copper chaperone PCu(A)C [Amaricoccus macauensis]|uniref:copper chaperone PCu(A)C n=1 Tax=Amaricoccus macauensis TaxID=57001 RepID=UPI003C7DB628